MYPLYIGENAQSGPVVHILDCISDSSLHEVAFSVHLKRVAELSSVVVSNPMVFEQLQYAVSVVWELSKKSVPSPRLFVNCIANYEATLISFTIKAVCSSLESYGKNWPRDA